MQLQFVSTIAGTRKQTRRLAFLLLAVALGVTLSVGSPSRVGADQRTASGTWSLVSQEVTPIGMAGGTSFFTVVESPAYVGGLTGTAVDKYTLIVHSDGSFNAYGVETCTACTIGGRTGDFTAVFVFSGDASGGQGRLTFTGGTGGLAGLYGGGIFMALTPTSGTYAYNYDFAP